jgi:hypothetical protein
MFANSILRLRPVSALGFFRPGTVNLGGVLRVAVKLPHDASRQTALGGRAGTEYALNQRVMFPATTR